MTPCGAGAPPLAAAAACAAARPPRHGAPPAAARLPNGLTVSCVSRRDVLFLYKEVWAGRSYLRHGISLPRGGVVWDCGANIGLFSLAASEELGPQGLVIACEPLPPIFECLQRNAAAHRQWRQQQQEQQAGGQRSQQHQQPPPQGQQQQQARQQQEGPALPAPILCLNAGLGDGTAASATFTLYPRAAGWSTLQPESAEQTQDMMARFVDNALSSPEAAEAAGIEWPLAAAARTLRRVAPAWLFAAARRAFVGHMRGGEQAFTCPVLTVQQLVRQPGLLAAAAAAVAGEPACHSGGVHDGAARLPSSAEECVTSCSLDLAQRGIDLLKVDVERAELDVLRGVGDCWPLVRQAALEVHAENLEGVLQILRHEARFKHVVVEQESQLAGTELFAVFCRR